MADYKVQRLAELLEIEGGEDYFHILADSFKSKNPDVEAFLKTKAVQASKLNTANTYLVYTERSETDFDLVGYFSLAMKMLSLKKSALSSSKEKIIQRFSYFDEDSQSYKLPAILIGQFSRNFASESQSIKGADLMEIAIDCVRTILSLASGKIVFLECEKDKKIVDFYGKEQFRLLDSTVISRDKKELAQMYRIL